MAEGLHSRYIRHNQISHIGQNQLSLILFLPSSQPLHACAFDLCPKIQMYSWIRCWRLVCMQECYVLGWTSKEPVLLVTLPRELFRGKRWGVMPNILPDDQLQTTRVSIAVERISVIEEKDSRWTKRNGNLSQVAWITLLVSVSLKSTSNLGGEILAISSTLFSPQFTGLQPI